MKNTGIELITQERGRQLMPPSSGGEGWTSEHDDQHINGELASAAACYAEGTILFVDTHDGENQHMGFDSIWPWESKYWKPTPENRIKDLVRAGALIAAEIDRLQRQPIRVVKG